MSARAADWRSYLRGVATGAAPLLGQGMEGAVFQLAEDRVAKVWFRRQVTELHRLRDFYTRLQQQDLPFRVPEIIEIRQAGDRAVSIERALTGQSLAKLIAAGQVPPEAAQRCLLDVLASLRASTGGPAARALPVLDERDGMWAGHHGWTAALGDLARRRIVAAGDRLRMSVPGFDHQAERILYLLSRLPPARNAVIHGDLVPANILVDAEFRPASVLDWGFLSTQGDPAFEASVTAGIFDMYGPGAQAADDRLLSILVAEAGYSRQRLLLYRAVYAVLTATIFDPAGNDGHYAWCVRMLNRADVAAALAAG